MTPDPEMWPDSFHDRQMARARTARMLSLVLCALSGALTAGILAAALAWWLA